MPSTYAHYKFAHAVKDQLPQELKKIIENNLTLYLIGCHGPDILFYYKAIKRNTINDYGYGMHEKIAKPFFESAKDVINNAQNRDAALAYILGFVTHYALDSECHGYVEEKRAKDNVSHTKIEVEFDRALLLSDGKNPVKQKLANHIVAKKEYAQVIAPFFGLEYKTVRRTLKDMKLICNTFVAPCKLKRGILNKAFTLIGSDELKDQIVGYTPDDRCKDSTEILTQKLNSAIPVGKELIENFMGTLQGGELSDRFARNYE
ncbi:MAG: zinc dependent phospholipase C family protein [Candidatus Coproplasma sp.]